MSGDPQRTESHKAIAEVVEALDTLASTCPELATTICRVVTTVANEAVRSKRFSGALVKAIGGNRNAQANSGTRRPGRRNAGVIDPFATYEVGDEAYLRERLATLSLEQLRDIIAEHGMDNDRLAMKWKDPQRVIERVVERVVTRAAKGSAFRNGDV